MSYAASLLLLAALSGSAWSQENPLSLLSFDVQGAQGSVRVLDGERLRLTCQWAMARPALDPSLQTLGFEVHVQFEGRNGTSVVDELVVDVQPSREGHATLLRTWPWPVDAVRPPGKGFVVQLEFEARALHEGRYRCRVETLLFRSEWSVLDLTVDVPPKSLFSSAGRVQRLDMNVPLGIADPARFFDVVPIGDTRHYSLTFQCGAERVKPRAHIHFLLVGARGQQQQQLTPLNDSSALERIVYERQNDDDGTWNVSDATTMIVERKHYGQSVKCFAEWQASGRGNAHRVERSHLLFPPIAPLVNVRSLDASKAYVENAPHRFECVARRAAPTAGVRWLLVEPIGGQRWLLNATDERVVSAPQQAGLNSTISTLSLLMTRHINARTLTCEAENVATRQLSADRFGVVRSSIKLEISFAPSPPDIRSAATVGGLTVQRETRANATLLVRQRGAFQLLCSASANPLADYHWSHSSGRDLEKEGVANGSRLVVTDTAQRHSGLYTCAARNRLGESRSSVRVLIEHRPQCDRCRWSDRQQVQVGDDTRTVIGCPVGVDRDGWQLINCADIVSAEPKPLDKHFFWYFLADNDSLITDDMRQRNSTESLLALKRRAQIVHLGRSFNASLLSRRPAAARAGQVSIGYGLLLCEAQNTMGAAEEPCVFQVMPTTRPRAPTRCEALSVGNNELSVQCEAGWDGGREQEFHLLVETVSNGTTIEHQQPQQSPSYEPVRLPSGGIAWRVRNLPPEDAEYRISVTASNELGFSDALVMRARTTPSQDSTAGLLGMALSVFIVGLIVLFVLALLVSVLIVAIMKRRQGRQRATVHHDSGSESPDNAGSSSADDGDETLPRSDGDSAASAPSPSAEAETASVGDYQRPSSARGRPKHRPVDDEVI